MAHYCAFRSFFLHSVEEAAVWVVVAVSVKPVVMLETSEGG